MRFSIDHDYHIHTCLSVCAQDEGQIPRSILDRAKQMGLRSVCITDHYWDERVPCNTAVNWWYEKQNHSHISRFLPLPKDPDVELLFGCEADMDTDNVIGLSPSRYDAFDFIVVSTTHFHHMNWGRKKEYGCEEAALHWVLRLEALLNSDLPFHKVGVAHLACSLIHGKSKEAYLESLERIPQAQMERLFSMAADKGLGIELNYGDMLFVQEKEQRVSRVFSTAKRMGCKFYLGSDAHSRNDASDFLSVFEKAICLLDLQESDKFILKR